MVEADLDPSAPSAASASPAEAAAGVLQLYRRQLDERHFRSDSAQLAVVAKLDDLRRRLIVAPRPPRVRLPRWLTGLTHRASRTPVRGLYVGRGGSRQDLADGPVLRELA